MFITGGGGTDFRCWRSQLPLLTLGAAVEAAGQGWVMSPASPFSLPFFTGNGGFEPAG